MSPPQLADPDPLPPPHRASRAGMVPGILIVAVLLLGAFHSLDSQGIRADGVPRRPADLGEGLVTAVDPADRAAVSAAARALRLPAAERAAIEQDVLAGRSRLGWLVLTDGMAAIGDAVAVEAAGTLQDVVLDNAWTPVAVPLAGAPIGVTAVRDNRGSGVPVAVATRTGPVVLRILTPGERIEVAAP